VVCYSRAGGHEYSIAFGHWASLEGKARRKAFTRWIPAAAGAAI
jgi:hypothetical protein